MGSGVHATVPSVQPPFRKPRVPHFLLQNDSRRVFIFVQPAFGPGRTTTEPDPPRVRMEIQPAFDPRYTVEPREHGPPRTRRIRPAFLYTRPYCHRDQPTSSSYYSTNRKCRGPVTPALVPVLVSVIDEVNNDLRFFNTLIYVPEEQQSDCYRDKVVCSTPLTTKCVKSNYSSLLVETDNQMK